MSRRYDKVVTTFSPEGRLHQVEYAVEAINQAGACVGIVGSDGVVIAAEKQTRAANGRLLEKSKSSEKIYKVDDHVAVCVAGLSADANVLVEEARLAAARYRYAYGRPVPVEQLVQKVCGLLQVYTQYGGQRPFGVKLVFAGYDHVLQQYQLFATDPSGTYAGYKALCSGQNATNGQSVLRNEYPDEAPSLKDCLPLALKVMNKTSDSEIVSDSTSGPHVDLFSLSSPKHDGSFAHFLFPEDHIAALFKDLVDAEKAAADAAAASTPGV
mmetsp:Transcript_1965/g.5834  ORF Transcript_1965/g.5834 Transcript_1965/m.5834 type:complete len:269 (-) Transcript_1965:316-1122(-)